MISFQILLSVCILPFCKIYNGKDTNIDNLILETYFGKTARVMLCHGNDLEAENNINAGSPPASYSISQSFNIVVKLL